MSREVLTEEQIKWAHEKWSEGHSLAEIAAALFVGRTTVYRAFKRRKLKKLKVPIDSIKR